MNYDVIVIGAGNGGLAAAATCAKAGLSTLLLEKHNIPGGAASSFVRGRFEFDPSLHELCEVGTQDKLGTVDEIFNRIGIDIDWCSHPSTFRLIVPAKEGDTDAFVNEDGVRVTVDARMPNGYEAFAKKLDELVPGSYDSCMAAFDLSIRMNALFDATEDLSLLPGTIKDLPDVMRLVSHSLKDLLDTLGMPKKAQDIFCTYWSYMGAPASIFDSIYLTVIGSYVKFGSVVPRNRSHAISIAIDKAIRDYGGDIWYNSEVTKVITKNGKPAGVVINGEKEVHGKYIICNAVPNIAWSELFDLKDVPEKQLRMLNARKVACSLSTVYIGLNKSKEELGLKDYSIFIAPDSDSDKQYEAAQKFFNGYCIINCVNNIIPDCSPEGTTQLFLTTITFGDSMKGIKPQDYKKFKTEVAKDMIETCEKALNISITPYIEEIEIALPPTFARYLNTPWGTPYGYMLEKWDSIIPRTVQAVMDRPFDNFFFCGASQQRGDGYSSAYFTGEQAAKEIIMMENKKGGK